MANNNRVTKGLKDIADAIRAKTGDDGKMTAAEMPEKIESIPVGIDPEGTKEISANGEFNVREFESVNVNVPGATTKDKLDVTENGEYNIAEYAKVDVNVPVPDGYIKPEGTREVELSGYGSGSGDYQTFDVEEYKYVRVDKNGFMRPEGTRYIEVSPYGSNSYGSTYDIRNYEYANIRVSSSSSGTKYESTSYGSGNTYLGNYSDSFSVSGYSSLHLSFDVYTSKPIPQGIGYITISLLDRDNIDRHYGSFDIEQYEGALVDIYPEDEDRDDARLIAYNPGIDTNNDYIELKDSQANHVDLNSLEVNASKEITYIVNGSTKTFTITRIN